MIGKRTLRIEGKIQIEGIAEQNSLKEIFEHDPFNCASGDLSYYAGIAACTT